MTEYDTAKAIFNIAMAIQELTNDPKLILPIIEHCSAAGVEDAYEWLFKYHNLVETNVLSPKAALNTKEKHKLLMSLIKAKPEELDYMKWEPWCCNLSNRWSRTCTVTGDPCPKHGVNAQCEIWNEHTLN